MTEDHRECGIYGAGTFTDKAFVPAPEDTDRIFRLLASQTPGFTRDEQVLSKVKFTGEPFPVIPGAIKSVPVAAALHGMAGIIADEILTLRGEQNANRHITINTTHAALWLGSIGLSLLDGEDISSLSKAGVLSEILPDWEQGWTDTPLKFRATAIYPTADSETWYSLHGSMDAIPVLRSIGIDPSTPIMTIEEAAGLITDYTKKLSPEKLEFTNILNGFCGSICFTPQAWNESQMGKSLARHRLINVKALPQVPATPPIAFLPLNPSDKRPLAGIKVVELTRVIAGPQIGVILSSFGADVIKINPPHLPDVNVLQLSLNAGKRTITLDLRDPSDSAIMQSLIREADVFIQGYRTNKVAKYGLALSDLLQVATARSRGIVYVSENCYGPDGYYAERPGWQQIADAASGATYVTGRSLSLPDHECVLPSLPISDMTTGIVGAVGTMLALRDRAIKGGSYEVHASLVATNVFALSKDVGLYPREVVEECQRRFDWGEMRGCHHVIELLGTVRAGWQRVLGHYLEENSGLYQGFQDSAFGGRRLSLLKPVTVLSDVECTPWWRSSSVPYGNEKAETITFR